MHASMNNSYIILNTQILRENIRAILGELPGQSTLIPVLKDDAYGLGLTQVSKVFMEFPEIQTLAISHASEGVELRRANWKGNILVLGGIMGFLLPLAVEHDLTLTVGRLGLIPKLAEAARTQGKQVTVQVKIETGLNRIGLLPGAEVEQLIAELREASDCVTVTGAFSHFADVSDTQRIQQQYNSFLAGVTQLEEAGIPVPMRHLCGSAGLELCPQYALDGVRVGRRLYMDHPTQPTGRIREVASWRTYITNIRRLKAGAQLGYGGNCGLSRDTVIATIAVGYGDGLNEALADCQAPVLVNGQRAKLLCCCMDQSMVDVTGIPCQVDDEVTLFGYDSHGNLLSSQEVSLLIGENEGCGLISDLSPRVARIYQ